jgi:hypothetical protein
VGIPAAVCFAFVCDCMHTRVPSSFLNLIDGVVSVLRLVCDCADTVLIYLINVAYIYTSGSYLHSSSLGNLTVPSSPSPISRAKEPTLRQLQIRHSHRIKCIRKHSRTPPIRHRVTWITDCEKDDDTCNGCSCIYCCG